MAKTKAEQEKEIADIRNQIDALKCELEKTNRVESNNEEEQAWELTKTLVNNATTKRGLF